MVSITCIRYYSNCFFLLQFKFVQTSTVCTAVDINTINKVGMHHCTVWCSTGILVDEVFDSIYTI
jgi:hypothetical protein